MFIESGTNFTNACCSLAREVGTHQHNLEAHHFHSQGGALSSRSHNTKSARGPQMWWQEVVLRIWCLASKPAKSSCWAASDSTQGHIFNNSTGQPSRIGDPQILSCRAGKHQSCIWENKRTRMKGKASGGTWADQSTTLVAHSHVCCCPAMKAGGHLQPTHCI